MEHENMENVSFCGELECGAVVHASAWVPEGCTKAELVAEIRRLGYVRYIDNDIGRFVDISDVNPT